MYHLRNINMHNIVHTAQNCLNCNELYLVCHLLTLFWTIYLANRMQPYCPRWPPPMEMLVTGVNNQRLWAQAGERAGIKADMIIKEKEGKKCIKGAVKCSLFK